MNTMSYNHNSNVIEGLWETYCEYNSENKWFYISLKIWGSGTEFPYLDFCSQKHTKLNNMSYNHNSNVIYGSLEAYCKDNSDKWFNNFFSKFGGQRPNIHIYLFGARDKKMNKMNYNHNSNVEGLLATYCEYNFENKWFSKYFLKFEGLGSNFHIFAFGARNKKWIKWVIYNHNSNVL